MRNPLGLWAVLLIASTTGCKMVNPIPEREPDPETSSAEEIVADCLVVEYDNLSREWTDARVREDQGIRFDYTRSTALPKKLAKASHLVVLCHGWQNTTISTREFCSKLIKGVLATAGPQAEGLAFLAVSWNSERLVFHESALAAEVIGQSRLSPLLETLRRAKPDLRVTLVGHSLGARMVLATLQEAKAKLAESAVLLEGAVNLDALVPGREGGFGAFPLAASNVDRLANLHSRQDDVLRLTYDPAMQSPALGREGARRDRHGGVFPAFILTGMGVKVSELDEAFARPEADVFAGGRVVNVDATAVVSGHSNIFELPVYDLIWRLIPE